MEKRLIYDFEHMNRITKFTDMQLDPEQEFFSNMNALSCAKVV